MNSNSQFHPKSHSQSNFNSNSNSKSTLELTPSNTSTAMTEVMITESSENEYKANKHNSASSAGSNDIQKLSSEELIFKFKKIVKTERKITQIILNYIGEIESRKIYAQMGYDSMYNFLIQEMGYSQGAAYRRIQSARLLRNIPELSDKIESGSVNLSQLVKIQKLSKIKTTNPKFPIQMPDSKGTMHFEGPSNSEKNSNSEMNPQLEEHQTFAAEKSRIMDIIHKIENKNMYDTEKILAAERCEPIVMQDKITFQKNGSLRIELTISEAQFEQIKECQNYLSHKIPYANLSMVIVHVIEYFIQNKYKTKSSKDNSNISPIISPNIKKPPSPPYKIENSTPIAGGPASINKTNSKLKISTRNIPSSIKRIVFERAGGRCEFVNHRNGKRCESKYQTEIDHIQPWSLGGDHHPNNLRVLCRTHNQLRIKTNTS